MKRIYTISLSSIFLTNRFAQKETFDIIAYSPQSYYGPVSADNKVIELPMGIK